MGIEQDIKTVLTGLMNAANTERLERNQTELTELAAMYDRDKERFWTAVELGQHEFNGLVAAILAVPPQKNVYIVEHIVSGLYEHYILKYIEKAEGDSCCRDKSRFIRRRTLRALYEKTNTSLFDDYMKTDRITENKERRAYWSPETIPDTDTAMSMFWDWYLLRM